MLLKCQINTNMNKNGFLLSTKCLERVLKYSYLISIISIFRSEAPLQETLSVCLDTISFHNDSLPFLGNEPLHSPLLPRHAHNMYTTCLGHIYDMFTTCSRHFHDMFTTFLRHVYDIFTTCV